MHENLNIRPAVQSDLEGIVYLLSDDKLGKSREDSSQPLNDQYIKAFAAMESDNNQLLVVAESDGLLVGCLQLSFIPGLSRLGLWRGQIESVRVSSDFRGSGFGQKLLEWAIGECAERDCGLVQLTTDKDRPDALRFYESFGFVPSHEGMKLNLK